MQCEVCGNHYDDSFTVNLGGETYTFDCFECAIHALAPTCAHCGCKVIGHGVAREGETFCCEHCARVALADEMDDESDVDTDEMDVDYDDEIIEEAPAQRRR